MGFGEIEQMGIGEEGFGVMEEKGIRVLGGFIHVSISGRRSDIEEERTLFACFVLEFIEKDDDYFIRVFL